MQFKALIFASLATLALGQATSTAPRASSTCAAQNILDACLGTTKNQVTACNQTDYDCLCTAYGVVLTCYNNCPGDSGTFGAQQNRDQFCNAASAYGTKTATKTATAAATSATMVTTTTGTRTSTASAAASTSANAAPAVQVGSGLIAVAVAGLGLLL